MQPTNDPRFLSVLEGGGRDFRKIDLTKAEINALAVDGGDFLGARLQDIRASSCTFRGCEFVGTDMTAARIFNRAAFERCAFVHTRIRVATFEGVTFKECFFRNVNIDNCQLSNVAFDHTEFEDVTLKHAILNRVTCDGEAFGAMRVSGGTFVATDLAPFEGCLVGGLESGMTVDWSSVAASLRMPNLERFLVETGMPEVFALYMIDCARALDPERLTKLMRSTFISYGGPDAAFALQLSDDLHRNGVQTFFFEKDAIPGERLHDVMTRGVNRYDRVIVICSETSLLRPGVQNELQEALAREARDGGASYIIPVALDDFIFRWDTPLGRTLRDRVVAKFMDARLYRDSLSRLLRSLRSTDLMVSA